MKTRFSILLSLLVFVLLAGCVAPAAAPAPAPASPQVSEPEPAAAPVVEPKVFRAPSAEPDSLDPSKGGFGYQEYQNLYEGLVDAATKDGTIKPLAAESFTISDDGLIYTFALRKGLKWSDGEPVTAADFRWAWLRQLNPETASYVADEFYAIKNGKAYNQGEITDPEQVGIQAVDDLTLVVTLEEPSPIFLRFVGNPSWVPLRQDVLEKYGDKWMEAGNHVGNGPYMLTEWNHDQNLVFEQNPFYAGPWLDSRKIDRIEFTVVQDPWSMAVPGYEAGELDVAIVPSTDLDRIKADPELSQQLQQLPISGANIMIFDTKNPPTDDVRVRQALTKAIDRNVLANAVLKGAYEPATSFSPPDLASYHPDSFLSYDPEGAKALLAEAGYPDGAGFPPVELVYWSLERESLCAQAIEAMWKETLGIEISLQVMEPQAMRDYRISRATEPFNIYLALNWSGIPDPREFHNGQLDPDQNVRHSRYDNPEYVQLIRDALTEMDVAKRKAMYQQAEDIINTDSPIVPLVYEGRAWLVQDYVKNFAEVTTEVAEMTRVASPPGLDIVK